MADDDDDEKVEKVYNERIIHHSDIKDKELEEKIIKYSNEALEGSVIDKDICTKLKKLLDADVVLSKTKSNPGGITGSEEESELGIWQVIVGRAFSSSASFDAEYLVYFSFPKLSKYFLIFRS